MLVRLRHRRDPKRSRQPPPASNSPVSVVTVTGPSETAELLREWGALLEGDHFVYISGQHGSGWIDKDIVYPHTDRTSM